jgi:hypothetical protein
MSTTLCGSTIDCQIDIDETPVQPWMRGIEHKPLNLPTEIVVDDQLIAITVGRG